jgi:hypothetical protein
MPAVGLLADCQVGLYVYALLHQRGNAAVLARDHDAGSRLPDAGHGVGHAERPCIDIGATASAADATLANTASSTLRRVGATVTGTTGTTGTTATRTAVACGVAAVAGRAVRGAAVCGGCACTSGACSSRACATTAITG